MPDCMRLTLSRSNVCFKAGPKVDRPMACRFFSSFTNVAWLSFHPACNAAQHLIHAVGHKLRVQSHQYVKTIKPNVESKNQICGVKKKVRLNLNFWTRFLIAMNWAEHKTQKGQMDFWRFWILERTFFMWRQNNFLIYAMPMLPCYLQCLRSIARVWTKCWNIQISKA